jgi:hypothetical protein
MAIFLAALSKLDNSKAEVDGDAVKLFALALFKRTRTAFQ